MNKNVFKSLTLCLALAAFGCSENSTSSDVGIDEGCKLKCQGETLIYCENGEEKTTQCEFRCDTDTLSCKEESTSELCKDKTCPEGQSCSPETGQCIELDTDPCKDKTCPKGQTCSPETGQCIELELEPDFCKDKTCPNEQSCNPDTGDCMPVQKESCTENSCPAGTHCNIDSGDCDMDVVDLCQNKTCPEKQTCDANTGACVDENPPTCKEGFHFNAMMLYKNS